MNTISPIQSSDALNIWRRANQMEAKEALHMKKLRPAKTGVAFIRQVAARMRADGSLPPVDSYEVLSR